MQDQFSQNLRNGAFAVGRHNSDLNPSQTTHALVPDPDEFLEIIKVDGGNSEPIPSVHDERLRLLILGIAKPPPRRVFHSASFLIERCTQALKSASCRHLRPPSHLLSKQSLTFNSSTNIYGPSGQQTSNGYLKNILGHCDGQGIWTHGRNRQAKYLNLQPNGNPKRLRPFPSAIKIYYWISRDL